MVAATSAPRRGCSQGAGPQLQTLSTAVTNALVNYSWEPLDGLELSDHSMPRLTTQVIGGLGQRTAKPFTDGMVAVHELDQARETVALVASDERERVEHYGRRIEIAGAIATAMSNSSRGHRGTIPRHTADGPR